MAPVKLARAEDLVPKPSRMGDEHGIEDPRAAGVPDWREAAQYDLSQLSTLQLTWECLRRSPTYRAAWRRARIDYPGFRLHSLIDPATRPSDTKLRESLCNSLELPKWRLSKDIAPFMSPGEYERQDAEFVRSALRGVQNDEGRAVLVFDLLKPLHAQLAEAKELLDERKAALDRKRSAPASRPPARKPKSAGTRHRDAEPDAGPPSIKVRTRALANIDESLRVVDARNAGTGFPEIGRVLYPDIDLDNAVARARRRFDVIWDFWQERDPWR